MKTIRILIADDHALLRHGLEMLISHHDDLLVVGNASNGLEAIRLSAELRPDVIIMDLMMPKMDGVEATRRVRDAAPSTKVLILTTFGDSADVARAIQAGASGALVKDADDDELISAIRTVASGGQAFSAEIQAMVESEPKPPEFSPRQQEVFKSLIRGLTSEAIAANLGISTDAVKQHLDAIRRKLGAANRAEAVAIALRKHLLRT